MVETEHTLCEQHQGFLAIHQKLPERTSRHILRCVLIAVSGNLDLLIESLEFL